MRVPIPLLNWIRNEVNGNFEHMLTVSVDLSQQYDIRNLLEAHIPDSWLRDCFVSMLFYEGHGGALGFGYHEESINPSVGTSQSTEVINFTVYYNNTGKNSTYPIYVMVY